MENEKNNNTNNNNKPEMLLSLASILICLNSFFDGVLIEKIAVLIGLALMIISSILIIEEHKGENKKGLKIFFVCVALISTVAFLGLSYRAVF